jgi:hypothetical protein
VRGFKVATRRVFLVERMRLAQKTQKRVAPSMPSGYP